MRTPIVLLLILFASITTHAQQASVKGTINDTTNKQPLANTVIALLREKDSVLYTFTRSDKDGNFKLPQVDTGKYIMLVTQNTYADYVDHLAITNTAEVNLGNIPMTLMAHLLDEVVVQQTIAAMRLKGDTLVYEADSFKVREGASVEEMLRKLPGIQVDKDGKVTAQGETVEKVLVDGEEFFGDDPTIATKNLQADAVKEVQVFDKKSDQATFTGIDDGQKSKTINLKLKADKKKGSFGKVDLASDFKNRWNNSAMINNFKGSVKVSAYGIMSSTGKTGLDWEEREKYGSGSNMQYDEDNGYFYSFSNDDDLSNSNYYGEGIPKSWSAGLNLSNKFDDDNQTINGSYRFNKLNTAGSGKNVTQSLLPNNYFVNRDSGNTYSSKFRHSVNATYEWKIDSSTSIKFIGSGYTGSAQNYSEYNSLSTNKAGVQVNNSSRTTSSSGDNQNLNLNFLLRKKFKKMGRSLSVNITDVYNGSNTTGLLNANVNYFDDSTGAFMRDSLTDQLKKINSRVNAFSSKITYTEPIIKKVYVELNYALRSTTSNSEKLSYDRDQDDKYKQLNELYSNHYQFDVLTNNAGAAFRYNGKKLTASAGTDIGFTNFDQKDLMRDTVYQRNYTNFFPKANLSFKFSGSTRLNINYNGSTQQPTIEQIQPIRDNTNPLIITVGNSNLQQSFNHSIFFNFNSFQMLKQKGFYIYGSFNAVSNAIVTDQNTDSSGITTLKYFNRNGNYNFYSGGNYSMKLKKLDLNVNGGFNFQGSSFSNRVNGVDNITTNNAPGLNIGFSKYKEKKFNFYYYGSFNYNISKSSIQQGIKTNYWTQNHTLNGTVNLPGKIEINSDINFNLRQKTALFSNNNNVVLWNAYIGRRLLKNDKAIIKIAGYDILNQNKGYNRTINSNVLQERTYETIRRYFTLSFNWNFSKTAAGVQPAAQQ